MRLAVSLLGSFQVTLNGQSVTQFGYDKVRALLAILAMEANRPLRREQVEALLWPDQPPQAAHHNLSQALLKLRRALHDPARAPVFLDARRGALQFNLGPEDWLDVREFEQLIEQCASHVHDDLERCAECITRFERAVALHRGEFLEGLLIGDSAAFEEWAVIRREGLRQQAVDALARLSRYWMAQGEYARAYPFAQRRAQMEPYQEQAHREIMLILARGGQPGAALAHYENCRRILREELGIEPSAETRALYEQIRRSVARNDETQPHNLPLPLPPLIGRERELAQLTEQLSNSACRLLTLTGAGGIGKTMLALHAGYANRAQFPDGVFFVPLVSLDDPAQVPPTLAKELSLTHSETDPKARVLEYLRDKSILLILDNLEQLLTVDAVARQRDDAARGNAGTLERSSVRTFLAEMLAAAPGLKLLATSRERLNLRAEWVFPVEGLAYPSESNVILSEANGNVILRNEGNEGAAVGFTAFGAVQLFVERAKRVAPTFAPNQAELVEIARLCRFLRGSPLAIALAAAWTGTMPLPILAAEIRADLDFLQSEHEDVPARHRSMRALFEHSWRRLDEAERAVLRRLVVFHNPFRRAAAQAVTGATTYQLAALVSKSFLSLSADERYDLHPLLKQYLSEKLGERSEDRAATRSRHAVYFGDFMARMHEQEQSGRLDQAQAEVKLVVEDVCAALHWAVAQRDWGTTNKIHPYLYRYYAVSGDYHAGKSVFERVIRELREYENLAPEGQVILGKMLGYVGVYHIWLAEYDKGREWLQQSLALSRQVGDSAQVSFDLHALGIMVMEQGNLREARALLEEALEIRRQIGGEFVRILASLGSLWLEQGQPAEAKKYYTEALAIVRATHQKSSPGLALALNGLGVVAHRLGEPLEARAYLEQSLEVCQAIGHTWGTAECLDRLARLTIDRGDYAHADVLLQESAALYRQIGKRAELALCQRERGWLMECQGEYDAAREWYAASRDTAQRAGKKIGMALALTDWARICARQPVGQDDVESKLQMAHQIFTEIDSPYGLGLTLTARGIVARARGNLDQAQAYLHAALAKFSQGREIYERLKTLVELADLLVEQGRHNFAAHILNLTLQHPATPLCYKQRVQRLRRTLEC